MVRAHPRSSFRPATWGLAAAVSALGTSAAASDAPRLFTPATGTDTLGTLDPTVLRSRPVGVDFDVLDAAAVGDEIRFNFFEDASFLVVLERSEVLTEGRTAWLGSLVGYAGDLSLVFGQDILVANLRGPGERLFQVRALGSGGHAVREADAGRFADCATDHQHEITLPGGDQYSGGGGRSDDGSVFDVMVVYTPLARNAAGGVPAINALIDLAIVETNQAYHASQVNSRVRLVYKGKVAYAEDGDFGTHLDRLRRNGDGFMDEIHAIRGAVGADLVAMLVEDGQYCGIGYLMTSLSDGFKDYAFSVTNLGCATGYFSFGHELGHNMGCHHDRDNAGGALYPYSYGYRWYGDSGRQWRTVMSYSPGSRIAYFSNPDVDHDGQPTGIDEAQSNSANNALSLNNAALTISRWFDTTDPVGSLLFSTGQPGSAGGLSWTRGDVVQLDLATDSYSLLIDLSDVIPGNPNCDGLHMLPDGSFLLSFTRDLSIPGLGGGPSGDAVSDEDLVRFIPTQTGVDTTGSFEFYFDGSDVGAGDTGEDVDALSMNGDRLQISFRGNFDLGGGLTGNDEDIVEFAPSSLGANTTGNWALLFDGGDRDVKLAEAGEDVNGLHYAESTSDLHLTVAVAFKVPVAQAGQADDVITFLPTSLGASTQGTFMFSFEGGSWGLVGQNLSALFVIE